MAKAHRTAPSRNTLYGTHRALRIDAGHRSAAAPTEVQRENDQDLDWVLPVPEDVRDGENIDLDVEAINERLERRSRRDSASAWLPCVDTP
jgi:hypothetical protein